MQEEQWGQWRRGWRQGVEGEMEIGGGGGREGESSKEGRTVFVTN